MSSLDDSHVSADGLAGESRIPLSRRVFVNRNLRMPSIRAIGFDMDHTLAVYRKEPLENLAYYATRDKLVREKNYPEAVANLQYNPKQIIRGLVVDKRRGNILKIDQYNYVVRGHHGTRVLEKQQRKRLYRNRRIRLSSSKYMSIDTLFGLPEAALFAQLIDFFDANDETRRRDYTRVYDDVRECIDRAHADNTIKREIIDHPGKFFFQDEELAETLQALAGQGKKLFLLTNSESYYTQVVMEYLLDGMKEAYPTWRDYFDCVVVSSGKPGFFNNDEPLQEMDGDELKKAGMSQIHARPIFVKGGSKALEGRLGFHGDEILYMGDHTFGDILRAKKRSRWRTAMVVEELAGEIDLERQLLPAYQELYELGGRRLKIVFQLDRLRQRRDHLTAPAGGPAPTLENSGAEMHSRGSSREDLLRDIESRVQELDNKRDQLNMSIEERREQLEQQFNPHWGKLFKCGQINSRFGHQVKDFACIYTSAVNNFRAYPESMYFRSPREIMPHEMSLEQT